MKKTLFSAAIVVLVFAFSSTSMLAQQTETKKDAKIKIGKTEKAPKHLVKPVMKKKVRKTTRGKTEKSPKEKAKSETKKTESKKPVTHKASKTHKSKKTEKTTAEKN